MIQNLFVNDSSVLIKYVDQITLKNVACIQYFNSINSKFSVRVSYQISSHFMAAMESKMQWLY